MAAVPWVSSEVNSSSTESISLGCPNTVDIEKSGCHTQVHRLAATTWLSSSDLALA